MGHLKNQYYLKYVEQRGVTLYKPAITLARTLRAEGIKTAVVLLSTNCAEVLEAAGIAQLFDARVDGKAMFVGFWGLDVSHSSYLYLQGAYFFIVKNNIESSGCSNKSLGNKS